MLLAGRFESETLWSYVLADVEVDGGVELPVDAFVELKEASDEFEKDTPRVDRW